MYNATTATKKVIAMDERIRVVQGGTSASKTISILLYLIHLAQSDTTPTTTSIVSESFPHLRRGCIKDFLSIMEEHQYYVDGNWDRTNFTYTFETKSKIEFFSVDQSEKVRGARRDRLFINEANNVTFSAFEELEVRTKEFIYIDFNPTSEFWIFTDVLGVRTDSGHVILTYKDNEALDQSIVDSIEQRKNRRGWWQVYGLGQLGEVEGKIYKDWKIIDSIPHEAKLVRYGLDFGYTNDPSSIVAVYEYNEGLIVDEITYQTGLKNRQIADVFDTQEKALTIADSAEPKSIDEIKEYGVNIVGAVKGKGSVMHRIQATQEKRISVTKRSINIIKEYRNYLWQTDKEGKTINEPEHQFSHSMDAISYAIASLDPIPEDPTKRRQRHIIRQQRIQDVKKDVGLYN
mgnify:CR=1 FL=1|jgi:phage terminase large subunit